MKIEICRFEELNIFSLYKILKLRSEVFVREQECLYQDMDEKDFFAIHVLGWKDEELIGYARCFDSGDYFAEAAIGRVLINKKYRNKGFAHQIVSASIDVILKEFRKDKIRISAQTYLIDFYKKHGFEVDGTPYPEDGIPHVSMIKV